MENWSKGKYGNISLIDSSHALELKPFLAEHIKIIDEVLSRKRSDLPMPKTDRSRLKEHYFENDVIENLHQIEEGLTLVRRQLVTEYGRIDILCADRNDLPLVLELKASTGEISAVDQITRYITIIQEHTTLVTRGIVVIQEKNSDLADACLRRNVGIHIWS